MSGFTPGPWLPGQTEVKVLVPDAPRLLMTGLRNAETEANARLIAVAPEMAVDGQFLLDRLDELEIPEELARDWIGHVEPAIARFRSAIGKAKAEGTAS